MAATKGGKPFRHLHPKRLSSLIAAMGSSYGGIFRPKEYSNEYLDTRFIV
jgi:hypothetical protein